jgi:hypothetical protein
VIGQFYLGLPTPEAYRDLLLDTHGPINAAFPRRYKRFFISGTFHSALGGDLFYTGQVDGVPLYQWTGDFLNRQRGWLDLVADAVPGSPSGAFLE